MHMGTDLVGILLDLRYRAGFKFEVAKLNYKWPPKQDYRCSCKNAFLLTSSSSCCPRLLSVARLQYCILAAMFASTFTVLLRPLIDQESRSGSWSLERLPDLFGLVPKATCLIYLPFARLGICTEYCTGRWKSCKLLSPGQQQLHSGRI